MRIVPVSVAGLLVFLEEVMGSGSPEKAEVNHSRDSLPLPLASTKKRTQGALFRGAPCRRAAQPVASSGFDHQDWQLAVGQDFLCHAPQDHCFHALAAM